MRQPVDATEASYKARYRHTLDQLGRQLEVKGVDYEKILQALNKIFDEISVHDQKLRTKCYGLMQRCKDYLAREGLVVSNRARRILNFDEQ